MSEGIRLKPYDGSIDFTIWKVKMKATLMKEKCYSAVTKDRPAETSELKKVKLNDMAHAEIFIRLSNDVARQVVSITDAQTLWLTLEEIFLSKPVPNLISLLCKFFTFKMDVSLTVAENLDAS
ncbi:hypothetical protein LINPERHAP2_LOCUS4789 [Linum perenne]